MSLFKKKSEELEDKLSTLQSKLDSVESENAQLRTDNEDLKEKAESIQTLEDEKQTLATEKGTLENEIETLKTSVKELTESQESFDAKVSEEARKLMVEMGHEPIDETNEQNTDIVSVFKGLKGKEAAEFYAKNKRALNKALK